MDIATFTSTIHDESIGSNDGNGNLIVLNLPDPPVIDQLGQYGNIPSMPIPAITRELYPTKKTLLFHPKESKTIVLGKLFVLLASPIEKYNLVRLLLSKERIISKIQILRHLGKYTDTEHINSGVIKDAINALDVGKSTESVTPAFIDNVINVLQLYWLETNTLKNATFNRLETTRDRLRNQVTLQNTTDQLDLLRKEKHISDRTDDLFPHVRAVFDICYLLQSSPRSIAIILHALLGSQLVIERVVMNALCDKPIGLASAIYKATSDMWRVVSGIEYLRTNMYRDWRRMVTLSREKGNVRFIVNVKPGIPCSSMRCTRILEHDYDAIVDKVSVFKDGVRSEIDGYCVEEKIDGERSFMHCWRDDADVLQIRFYSRNKIVQCWYGSYVGDPKGIITKYMRKEDFDGVQSLIIDGEMVTFDESKNCILGFQDVKRCGELLSQRLKEGKNLLEEKLYNKLLCFDIVYYNGQSLQSATLKERKSHLTTVFEKLKCKFVQMHRWNIGYNANDVKIAMIDDENKNAEGLVLKQWTTRYFVGTSNDWIKIKPMYIRDFIDDLDVTIIGKEGSNYICALYGGDVGDKHQGWFVSFCNVRFGLDRGILDQIGESTEGSWRQYTKGDEIDWAENMMKFGSLKPKFWIRPNDSVVIKIKAKSLNYNNRSEINRYVLNTSLRHPYCIGVRDDKMYNECDTIKDYEEKVSHSEKRRQVSMIGTTKKRRKRETVADKTVKQANQNFILSMEEKDDLFKGITFCVLTDSEMNGKVIWKPEINGLLKSHGAKIIDLPSQFEGSGLMVIADKHTTSVGIFKKNYNIFTFKWCKDCINTGALVRIDPSHCLSVNEDIESLAQNNIDEFGCNFTVNYDVQGIWGMSDKYFNHGHNSATSLDNDTLHAIGFSLYNKKVSITSPHLTEYEKSLLTMEVEIRGGNVVETGADIVLVGPGSVDEILARLQ